MPIHWNLAGQGDIYARKAIATFLVLFVNVGVAVLITHLPRIDPKFARYDEETKASLLRTFTAMRLAITFLLSLVALAGLVAPLISGD